MKPYWTSVLRTPGAERKILVRNMEKSLLLSEVRQMGFRKRGKATCKPRILPKKYKVGVSDLITTLFSDSTLFYNSIILCCGRGRVR